MIDRKETEMNEHRPNNQWEVHTYKEKDPWTPQVSTLTGGAISEYSEQAPWMCYLRHDGCDADTISLDVETSGRDSLLVEDMTQGAMVVYECGSGFIGSIDVECLNSKLKNP
eukprot:UN30052